MKKSAYRVSYVRLRNLANYVILRNYKNFDCFSAGKENINILFPFVHYSLVNKTMSKTEVAKPKFNIEGPVSRSIGHKLKEERVKFEKSQRKPHPASFRGWQEFTGFEKGDEMTQLDEVMDLLTRATTLEQYLPEYLYGDWYHGIAVVILACILCSVLGWFRLNVGRTFMITLLAAFYYRTSIRKYRLNLKLEAQREFSVKAIEDDFETLDWMNVFLDKYWKFLEPSLSEQICEQVNDMIAPMDSIPAFIKEIWIYKMTLGTKPPRVDKVRTLDRTQNDVTVMDWWVSMTPNAMEDSTIKQMKNKANQEIIIKAKLFGLTIPICVNDVTFQAKMRVRIRMMPQFPHVQTINVSMMEQPYIDFMAKPVGADSIFSWEIFNIPGLYLLLTELIKKYAGPIVFSPLSFQLNLEQMLAGNGVNGALGIMQIDVKDAHDLLGADTFNNTIDPYFTFGFSGKVVAKTKYVPDTCNPTFNETIRIILSSSADPLAIYLYDENEADGRKDKFMGGALYDLDELMSKGSIKNVELPILRNNKEAGKVRFDISLMKSLQGSKLPDGSYSPPEDYNTGVVKLNLLGGRDYSEDEKTPTPVFCEIYVEGVKKNTSAVSKTAKANWNQFFESIIYDRSKTNVQIVLREAKSKDIIGSSTLQLSDIIDASFVGNSWFRMNKGRGEVNLSCVWNSVKIPGLKGSLGYTLPVGIVRIYIEKAEDLLNLEKFGVIDPYVRIMINDNQRGRTLTKGSTTAPVYNESIYVPVSSINQRITIEAMDVRNHTQDRTLGSLQIRLNEFVDFNSKDEPIETISELKNGRLYHRRKGDKGIINYSISYYPVEAVSTPSEIVAKKAKREEILSKIAKEKECEQKGGKINEIEKIELLQTEEDSKPKRELQLSDLESASTGVLIYTVCDLKTNLNGQYLQIFFDKRAYPVSEAKISTNYEMNLASDYMVKELNYSKVSIRISDKPHANYLQETGKFTEFSTREFIKMTYDKECPITLADGSVISMNCRFMPILLKQLPAADSIGNSGQLYVNVISATGLPAGDSNGKSDPFTKIYLNSESIYKTKTKKKTLEPVWNESFDTEIVSRVQSFLRFKVVDWDFGVEQDDSLCEATYQLKKLDPFNGTEDLELQLLDKQGNSSGSITVQLKFVPEYKTIVSAERDLPNAASFAVDGAGKVIGTGFDGAGKVLGTANKIGHSVGKLLTMKKK